MKIKEYLELLELPADATPSRIRSAYIRLVKHWHPDRFPADSPLKAYAEERIKIINAAYDGIRKQGASVLNRQNISKNSVRPSPSRTENTPQDTIPKAAPANRSLQSLLHKFFSRWRSILAAGYHADAAGRPFRFHPQDTRKPLSSFQRVMEDLKKNMPHSPAGGKRRRSKSGAPYYHHRHAYGPRRRKGLGPISGPSAVERNRAVTPISKIAPIIRVR